MPHSKGYRHKTRSLLTLKGRSRALTALFRNYEVGDKVVIDIDPRMVKGMPHRRFQGQIGSVEEVGRRSLAVTVPVGGKTKKVIGRLEHFRPVFSGA